MGKIQIEKNGIRKQLKEVNLAIVKLISLNTLFASTFKKKAQEQKDYKNSLIQKEIVKYLVLGQK